MDYESKEDGLKMVIPESGSYMTREAEEEESASPEPDKEEIPRDHFEESPALLIPDEKKDIEEEINLDIRFNKPYRFEGNDYFGVDLNGLNEMSGQDMAMVERSLSRTAPEILVAKEMSVEYAILMAARVARKPVEFFQNLPAIEMTKIKNRIMAFFYGEI